MADRVLLYFLAIFRDLGDFLAGEDVGRISGLHGQLGGGVRGL
jgi:hypothetical protein